MLVISGMLTQCGKKETLVTQTEYNAKIKNSSSVYGLCGCGENPCKFYNILFFCPCAKRILNNQDSRNFVVNWYSSCCGNPYVSYGKVCYTGDKNELYVELSGIPSCLRDCFGETYCFRANIIKCNKNTFYIGWNDSNSNVMELSNDDIYLHLKCNVNGITYECKGSVNWQ